MFPPLITLMREKKKTETLIQRELAILMNIKVMQEYFKTNL